MGPVITQHIVCSSMAWLLPAAVAMLTGAVWNRAVASLDTRGAGGQV